MIDGLTPLEFFRSTFLFDFLSCLLVYAISWPLGAGKLIGGYLEKAIR